MSPQSLTEDMLDDATAASPEPAREPRPEAHSAVHDRRPRLTVREMQIALEAARSVAGAGPPHCEIAAQRTRVEAEPAVECGSDRSRAVPCHDALEGESPMTATIAAPAATETAPTSTSRPAPWLPEHDGPVSLTGVAAPRTRTVRRAAATPDKAARQPTRQRSAPRAPKTATLDSTLAAEAVTAPPRVVIIAACGGAGATTMAVLLAAALAPVTGALLLASGTDRGSLSVRANASRGDIDALTAWVAQHPGQPLRANTPGMADGDCGSERFLLAVAARTDLGHDFGAADAVLLLTAAARTRAAVLLDWSCPAPLPESVWASATHVLVTAPATSPGLLTAEYVMQNLQAARAGRTPLSLLSVDIRGRPARRGGRAALARLDALNVPVTSLPYDPALADDPGVHWPALRPRTRTAVIAALTQLLHSDQHRKDPR